MTTDTSLADNLDDLFVNTDPRVRIKGRLAPVLIFASADGGTGVTSFATSAAELASNAGKVSRTVLADADLVGSGVRQLLRGSGVLPTLLTAQRTGDVRTALVSPGTMNADSVKTPDISFHTILTPSGLAERAAVEHSTALASIEAAASVADLVIVDGGRLTPYVDGSVTQDVIEPLLRSGAWLVLLTTPTQPGLVGAVDVLRALTARTGVRLERLMFAVNHVPRRTGDDLARQIEAMTRTLAKLAVSLGSVPDDEQQIRSKLRVGILPTKSTALAPVLASALLRVTGRPEFEPIAEVKQARATELVAGGLDEFDPAAAPLQPGARKRLVGWPRR